MRNIPDYDLSDPSTWTVISKRDAISEIEEQKFQDGLIKIAGLNPRNEPNLVLRWAGDHHDPMLLDDKPKYYVSTNDPILVGHQWRDEGEWKFAAKLEDVPAMSISLPVYNEVHLGERRFIVEIWRSPDFLKRSGRYQQTHLDEKTIYFECRNCREPVIVPPEFLHADMERQCQSCGSKRVSPVEIRGESEQLTRTLPSNGCYDFFYRIERQDGSYHPPDVEALIGIRKLWAAHLLSTAEKLRNLRQSEEDAAKQARQRRREIWHPDNMKKEALYEHSTSN